MLVAIKRLKHTVFNIHEGRLYSLLAGAPSSSADTVADARDQSNHNTVRHIPRLSRGEWQLRQHGSLSAMKPARGSLYP